MTDPSDPPARTLLRAATAAHHDRVDAVFSRATLSDPLSYGRFLRAQAAAHLPTEAALTDAGVATVIPDWDERQRSALLREDLAELGLAVPPPSGALVLQGEGALLGALYVLEGSRLGGAMLVRSVAPDLPRRYLGAQRQGSWRALQQLLDARLVTPADRNAAIATARTVFTLFEAGGVHYLT